jgi:hypothetical protein
MVHILTCPLSTLLSEETTVFSSVIFMDGHFQQHLVKPPLAI